MATDASGTFSAGVPGGTYTVVAWAGGHRPGAALVALMAGRAEVGLALPATGRVQGRVRLAPSTLPAIDVAVELACEGRPARHTMTDGEGHFDFPGADAGPAKVVAYRRGYRPEEVSLTVAPGATVECRLDLLPVGPMTGRVWAADGQPVGSGSVSIVDATGQVVHRAEVADGRFVIDEIVRGRFVLVGLAADAGGCQLVDTGAGGEVDLRLIDRSPIDLRSTGAPSDQAVEAASP